MRHIKNYKQIKRLVKEEKDPKVKTKLILLNLAGKGDMSVENACDAVGIDTSTGYRWIEA
jgi:hypothetical protein